MMETPTELKTFFVGVVLIILGLYLYSIYKKIKLKRDAAKFEIRMKIDSDPIRNIWGALTGIVSKARDLFFPRPPLARAEEIAKRSRDLNDWIEALRKQGLTEDEIDEWMEKAINYMEFRINRRKEKERKK